MLTGPPPKFNGTRDILGDRTGTMICDELPFNAEATRSPHASRRWSLVVDAAVGPLSITARLGFRRRNTRNLTIA